MTHSFEWDWLKKWNLFSPKRVALQDGDSGLEWTYSELYLAAQKIAHRLQLLGIRPGDRIAVLAQNDLHTIALFFGAQRIGAIIVPINYRLTTREVHHILQDSAAKVLFYQTENSGVVNGIPGDDRPTHSLPFDLLFDWVAGPTPAEKIPAHEVLPEHPVMILYTSGTTGSPKGAVLTHKMLFWNSINTTLRLNLSQDDCAVIFLPLFHTGGWNVLTTPFLHRGAKVVLVRKFDAEQVLRLSQDEKASLLFGVPTTMELMARAPSFDSVRFERLRYAIVGGEPMPVSAIEKWHKKGVRIRQGYGLTEFGPNVFSLNEEHAISKIGSIGFPNFYTEAQVVDESGNVLGANQVGELWLRGPMCMAEYWHNPEATNETIRNGWLATGDLVRFDEEGFFFVVGRKKDMFKSGGENVYPPELEKILREYPGVREAAVIGVPDPKWGEVGKAFVALEPTAEISAEQLLQFCQKHLAKFKIPKYVQFLPELPKGDSGKVLKRKLAELDNR